MDQAYGFIGCRARAIPLDPYNSRVVPPADEGTNEAKFVGIKVLRVELGDYFYRWALQYDCDAGILLEPGTWISTNDIVNTI